MLVSGGSVGTLTALAAAAHDRAEDRDQATGYVQEHTHAAIAKAWRVLGFNPSNLRVLKADPAHRLQASPVDAAVHLDREAAPAAVRGRRHRGHDLAPAASTRSTTSPTSPTARACGSTSTAPTARPRGSSTRTDLDGIERADSLVLDPHKWLFQPYEIGAVLVREPHALEHTFALDGAYLRDTAAASWSSASAARSSPAAPAR